MSYLSVVSITALLAVTPTFCLSADLQIVFYSDREGREIAVGQREREVFVMNPDGSNPVNLTQQIGVDRLPSVSPDKTKYLFSSSRTGDGDIYVVNVDGSNLVNLTNDPATDSSPLWSPDGTKILWYGWPAVFGAQIFVMNADGSDKRNLGDGSRPTWSPDGRLIGFTLHGRLDSAFVMNADGTGRRRVTDRLGEIRFISWSPDGSKIALHHHTPFGFTHEHIYVVNVDGTGLVELSKDLPDDCHGAAWSPDGTKIALTSSPGPIWYHIFVVNSDGTNPVNLTKHHPPGIDHRPRWSPDGREILFQTDRDGNREVYVMNADGTNPVNLTNHPADDRSATWYGSDRDLGTSVPIPQEALITTWGQIKAVTSGE